MKTPLKIMNAAKGENCTLAIAGVCNYDSETVVACHLPDGTGGSNKLTGPLNIAFGCEQCHAQIDRRTSSILSGEDREFYMRRGNQRTINRLIEKGLVKI